MILLFSIDKLVGLFWFEFEVRILMIQALQLMLDWC